MSLCGGKLKQRQWDQSMQQTTSHHRQFSISYGNHVNCIPQDCFCRELSREIGEEVEKISLFWPFQKVLSREMGKEIVVSSLFY